MTDDRIHERMADVLDMASIQEERARDAALEAARSAVASGPQPIGRCHWCSETVDAAALFCDHDCRDDWQRQRAARRRNGSGPYG